MDIKILAEELIDKYKDWQVSAESDDWTTINLCAEVIEDLKWLLRG